MKRIRFIFIIFIISCVIGLSFVFINTNLFQAELKVVNNQEIIISPKIKLLSIIHGGYYNLFRHYIDKGYCEKDALNHISIGLGDKLYDQAMLSKVEPKNAEVIFTGDYIKPFEYKVEVIGQQVDLYRLYHDTAHSLDDGREVIYHTIEFIPKITYELLLDKTALRGRFSTDYSYSTPNRKSNVELAASFINGYILEPECTMSFNQVVGSRTIERGFKEANIIFKGEMVQGTGGGVCQVSSTLYNACLISGLNIVYSSRHSQVIPYLAPSLDAMVSAHNDLIVANMGASPVFILAKADGERVEFSIYGERFDGEMKLRSKVIGTILPKDNIIIVEGDNIAEDIYDALLTNDLERLRNIPYREEIKIQPRTGIISEAYLDKYINGELVESKLISHDIYYPQQGEIIRSLI